MLGYDISTAQFPAKEWLPANVQLEVLDILDTDLPDELKGAFDVVHLRAFAVVIKRGEPRGVLDRVVEMLSMRDRSFVFLTVCITLSFILPLLRSLFVFFLKTLLLLSSRFGDIPMMSLEFRLLSPDDQLTDHLVSEPGGYLQWDEVDIGAYHAHSPNVAIGNASSQKLVEHFLAYVDACEFKFE